MGAKLVSQKCLDTLHNSMLHNGCTHTHTHTHTHTQTYCAPPSLDDLLWLFLAAAVKFLKMYIGSFLSSDSTGLRNTEGVSMGRALQLFFRKSPNRE